MLVTCFSSYGGFSSPDNSSPVCFAPSGVCSSLFGGNEAADGCVFGGEGRGVLKILDDGVTKVREWFVGSGDMTREESGTAEMSCESGHTSGKESSYSGQTCEGFSLFRITLESAFSREEVTSVLSTRKKKQG